MEDILNTMITFDETRPWEIIIYQVVFYCFRNFCLQRITESNEEVKWTNLLELCEQYCDKNFKEYLVDFFTPSHIEQIKDIESFEVYLKNFTTSLDTIIAKDNIIQQEEFIKFLDETIFNYFKNLLKDSEIYIFPEDIDGILNEEKYKIFKAKEFELKKALEYEIINDTIEFTKTESKKSIGYALKVKKLGLIKTIKHKKSCLTKTLKHK
jgi:hypothetical protein